jgi:hypothetical protein
LDSWSVRQQNDIEEADMGREILTETGLPEWSKTWQQSLGDVDAQIVNCCRAAKGSAQETVEECCVRVQRWFDNQPMKGQALEEYRQATTDPAYFRNQVRDRITQLSAAGKVNLQQGQQAGQSGQVHIT